MRRAGTPDRIQLRRRAVRTGLAAGALLAAYGVREWLRTGSPTARRPKSPEEQQQDERRAARVMRWHAVRTVLLVVVVAVVAVVALVGR